MKEKLQNQISENNITLDAFAGEYRLSKSGEAKEKHMLCEEAIHFALDAFAGDYYDENNCVSSVSRKLFEIHSRLKEKFSRQK